ncbi:MAG: helix-turn-helix domain-containing protein [Halobacterium sp.]
MSTQERRHPDDADVLVRGPFECAETDDAGAVVEAIADPRAREVLAAARQPATAAELADRCGLSSSTLYRKLDELRDAGLLAVQNEIRTDGCHAARFRTAVDETHVSVDDGGLSVSVDRAPDVRTRATLPDGR